MSGVNKAILIGYLGADPELRYTPKGDPVLRFRVAVTETWRDMSGAKRERTEWLSCVLWGKRGEALSAYLSRGSRVYIEGKIQTRKWEDKNGITRYSTGVVVSDVKLLGDGRSRQNGDDHQSTSMQSARCEPPAEQYDDGPPDDFDDDIPF